MTPKERKRKFTPKTRSGCITCKRRHVKCDEGRPTCVACVRAGFQCEGYSVPRQWLFESKTEGTKTLTGGPSPNKADIPVSDDVCNFSRRGAMSPYRFTQMTFQFGTVEEQRAFELCLNKTAPFLAKSESRKQLWTNIIPRLSWSSPTVRHMIVATALMDEYQAAQSQISLAQVQQDEDEKAPLRAIVHYRRGLQAMSQGQPPMTSCMAGCALAWAFEMYQRNSKAADLHLTSGSRIVSQWSSGNIDTAAYHEQEHVLDVIRCNLLVTPGLDLGAVPTPSVVIQNLETSTPITAEATTGNATHEMSDIRSVEEAYEKLFILVDRMAKRKISHIDANQQLTRWQTGFDGYPRLYGEPLIQRYVIQLLYLTAATILIIPETGDGLIKGEAGDEHPVSITDAAGASWAYPLRCAEALVDNAPTYIRYTKPTIQLVASIVSGRYQDDASQRHLGELMDRVRELENHRFESG